MTAKGAVTHEDIDVLNGQGARAIVVASVLGLAGCQGFAGEERPVRERWVPFGMDSHGCDRFWRVVDGGREADRRTWYWDGERYTLNHAACEDRRFIHPRLAPQLGRYAAEAEAIRKSENE